jgi:hypothetical protein
MISKAGTYGGEELTGFGYTPAPLHGYFPSNKFSILLHAANHFTIDQGIQV